MNDNKTENFVLDLDVYFQTFDNPNFTIYKNPNESDFGIQITK